MSDVLTQLCRAGYLTNTQVQDCNQDGSSITFETAALLYEFVRNMQPKKTIETGMANGISTLCLCQAHRDNGAGSHTAIDPLQENEFQSNGLRNIERANLKDLLRFYPMAADEVLPQLCSQNEEFEFAFIDGNHLFDFTLVDFFFIDKLLAVGGHVAFDDLWMPAVRKVVSFVLKNKPYQLVSSPSQGTTSGWTRALRSGRRILQNPFDSDWGLKFVPQNVALLQKVGSDERKWKFHRYF